MNAALTLSVRALVAVIALPLTLDSGSVSAALAPVAPAAALPSAAPPSPALPGIDPTRALESSRTFTPMFALISTASVATAFSLDRRTWHALSDSSGGATHRAGEEVSRFGDLRFLAPALIGTYAFGKLANLPGASSASARIGASVLGAGALCSVLKIATGRTRPDHSPGDSDEFSPFSGADAFPSGHTTVAFAFASALDQETRAAWIPYVAYPAAAAVGWARIAADRHWLSDVVAGAVLGTWAGREIDLRLRRRANSGAGLSARPIMILTSRRARVGLAIRF